MNSARLAKMQCPNCDSVGTIDIDDIEAQMYCTECCIVLAMNLGESDQTRWDGNEGLVEMREPRDADETMLDDGGSKGGKGRASNSSKGMDSGAKSGAGKKMDAVYDFIQCLQRKTAVPDTIPVGAVALYSQYLDRLRARTSKANIGGDGGQNAVAAAAFAITAARKGKTVAPTDLAKCVKELSSGSSYSEAQWANFILIKKSEIARALDIEAELKNLAEAEFEHLAQQFHLSMQWPLVSVKPSANFAKNLNRELSAVVNTSVTSVEAVVVGMYMTRASKKLSSLVVPPIPPALLAATPQPTTSETLKNLCAITRVELKAITTILTLLQSNKAIFEKLLNCAIDAVPRQLLTSSQQAAANNSTATATTPAVAAPLPTAGQKREREEPSGNDDKSVRVQLR